MNKDDECAICLDLIKEYDYVILSCKHMFHYKCLQSWLQTKKEYVKFVLYVIKWRKLKI